MHWLGGLDLSRWSPMSGSTAGTVMLAYSWLDLLRSLDKTSLIALLGEAQKHCILACLYVRLPGTYDDSDVQSYKPEDDVKCGFAFVRNDRKVLFVRPTLSCCRLDAYWLTSSMFTALAAERRGSEWFHPPFHEIKARYREEHFRYASDTTRTCLLYTSPSPRDLSTSRMPSSA